MMAIYFKHLCKATESRLAVGVKLRSGPLQVRRIDRGSDAVWYRTGSGGGHLSGEKEHERREQLLQTASIID